MKKWWLFIGVLLLLTGCAQQNTSATNRSPSEERPEGGLAYHMTNVASGGGSLFWETEDQYYMIYTPVEFGNPDTQVPIEKDFSEIGKRTDGEKKTGGYLFRTEKDTLDWQPVCVNKRCRHNGEYCTALLAQSAVSFGIYDEHIYFTSFEYADANELELYCMDLDGKERYLVDAFVCEDGWSTGGIYHEKYFIYYVYRYDQETDTIDEKIYCYSLKDEGDPVLILEEIGAADLASYRLYPVDDQLYLVRKNRDGAGSRLLRYDLQQGALETVVETYRSGSFLPEEEGAYVTTKGVGSYYLDFSTGEMSLIREAGSEKGTSYFDGTYYYTGLAMWEEARIGQTFKVYDDKGMLLQELEYPIRALYLQAGFTIPDDVRSGLPGTYYNLYYWGSTEDKVLFSEDVPTTLPTWYLEKDQIGTSQLEWKQGVTKLSDAYISASHIEAMINYYKEYGPIIPLPEQ